MIYKVIDKTMATVYLTEEAYKVWLENGGSESEDEIYVFDENEIVEIM